MYGDEKRFHLDLSTSHWILSIGRKCAKLCHASVNFQAVVCMMGACSLFFDTMKTWVLGTMHCPPGHILPHVLNFFHHFQLFPRFRRERCNQTVHSPYRVFTWVISCKNDCYPVQRDNEWPASPSGMKVFFFHPNWKLSAWRQEENARSFRNLAICSVQMLILFRVC